MNDEINSITCPKCKIKTRVEFPFLCTNIKRGIAIWYEPYYDSAIDKDLVDYSKHYGPDSFYARAPRIKNWEEFKRKLTELEALSTGSKPNVKLSPEMAASFNGFIESLQQSKQNSNNDKYPKWTVHINSFSKRIKYSLFAGLFLIIFLPLIFIGPSKLLEDIKNEFIQYVILLLFFSTIIFTFLTGLFLIIADYKPWRSRSFLFRFFCFACIGWIVGVLLFVSLFDPYESGSISYMFNYHWPKILSTCIAPPAFIGMMIYIYKKYVALPPINK